VAATGGGVVGTAGSRLDGFRAAGWELASRGLVRGSEGNLSAFDGVTLTITRMGSRLGRLEGSDLIAGPLEGPLPGASSDLDVHRAAYRERGPGAFAHAHPPGTVPEGGGGPGRHGVDAFAPTLGEAVEAVVRSSSGVAPGPVRPIEWTDGAVRILDQTLLPGEERYVEVDGAEAMAVAIRRLAVRGAPLLGVAGAYALAADAARSTAGTAAGLLEGLERAGRLLVASRPTAVNLGWAVHRVLSSARRAARRSDAGDPDPVRRAAEAEARSIAAENEAACVAIARFGSELVPEGSHVLTHCNTGALATGGVGTALGVVAAAHRAGAVAHVWVDETRPLLQGSRLTAWELTRLGIPMTLVADAAAGSLMARGRVDLVIVGADRIAARGDVANKVGTYPLAVLAERHGIPFVVAAPISTVDLDTADGGAIVIEERDPREVTAPMGRPLAPAGVAADNPAFDVTPAQLITAIVTDRGVARPPYASSLAALVDEREPAGRASA
jgi:methylthioribose-1-phosphate isomerase